MANYKFQIPVPGGAVVAESANRVIKHLTEQGYSLKQDGRPTSAALERGGSYLSMKDHRGPHELLLRFGSGEFVFDFRVGSLWKDTPSQSTFKVVVDRAQEEIVKKCPACAEYIRADARVCRFCQRSL